MKSGDLAILAIIVLVIAFAFSYMFSGPKRKRCGWCKAKMNAGEPSRKDTIIGGRPVTEITTPYTCPKCGDVLEEVELKKLANPKTNRSLVQDGPIFQDREAPMSVRLSRPV